MFGQIITLNKECGYLGNFKENVYIVYTNFNKCRMFRLSNNWNHEWKYIVTETDFEQFKNNGMKEEKFVCYWICYHTIQKLTNFL